MRAVHRGLPDPGAPGMAGPGGTAGAASQTSATTEPVADKDEVKPGGEQVAAGGSEVA